jgi:hypothetical protein
LPQAQHKATSPTLKTLATTLIFQSDKEQSFKSLGSSKYQNGTLPFARNTSQRFAKVKEPLNPKVGFCVSHASPILQPQ